MFAAGSDFATTTVTVHTRTGSGSNGDVFAASVSVTGYLEDGRRLVRNSAGEQVVSEATLFTDPSTVATFTVDSKVDLPTRTARVILAKPRLIGDPDVDHVEVVLT
jgi:hypothetical protein